MKDEGTFTLFISLTLLTVVSVLLYLQWSKRRNPGGHRLPPGPLGLPLLGSLPFLSPDLHCYFSTLAQTHGPILSLRLGSKLCIILTSPTTAREVLKHQDAIFANRDPPAAAPYSGVGILWASYGPLWQMLRRVSVRELLSSANIESLRHLRRQAVRQAAAEVRLKAGEAVEVRELAFKTALGVIRRMLWGEAAEGEESEFREVVDGVVELEGAANVSDFFPAVSRWDLQGLGRRMKGFTARFDRMIEEIVERRVRGGGGGESRSFLQVLLELMERGEAENPLTMESIRALLLDMVIGGADTTSTTVEWAMAELLFNPEKMRKAQEELDTLVGRNKVLEESDIPGLQFLGAVVKEVLRLHPAVPLLVPHYPSSDCVVSGYRVPKGTKVFINAWAIHRDPSLWEDPLEFKPERFLNVTEKYNSNGNNFNYLPFGSGRRVCAGISLGEKMVMYMLASLLHSFDWRLPQGGKLDLSEKFGIVLKKKEPLVAVPIVRLDDHKLYT